MKVIGGMVMKIMSEKLYISMRKGKKIVSVALMSAAAIFIANPPQTLAEEKRIVTHCHTPDTSTDSLTHIEGKMVRFVPMLEQSPVVLTTKPILISACSGGLDVGKTGHKKSL